MLNDYDFVTDPAKAGDTRWIHRPKMRWEFLDDLESLLEDANGSIRKRIFQAIRKMIHLRKELPAFAGQEMELVPVKHDHVLGFLRHSGGSRVIVVANFSEQPQTIQGNVLRTVGLGRFFQDALTERTFPTSEDITLGAYDLLWLERV